MILGKRTIKSINYGNLGHLLILEQRNKCGCNRRLKLARTERQRRHADSWYEISWKIANC
jgi:hypothetical protein